MWRYMVSIQASDHVGQSWLTCFGEAGETLFEGLKAPELKRLETEDPKLYDKKCMVRGERGEYGGPKAVQRGVYGEGGRDGGGQRA